MEEIKDNMNILQKFFGLREDEYKAPCPRCLGDKEMKEPVFPDLLRPYFSVEKIIRCWLCKGTGIVIKRVGM